MDPDKTPEVRQKRPSRFGSAWMALRGETVIPASIRAEWAVVQIQIQNLLDQVTTAAARAYERDRVKLKAAAVRIEELEAVVQVHTAPEVTAVGWNPAKVALLRQITAEEEGLPIPTFTGEPHVNGVETSAG